MSYRSTILSKSISEKSTKNSRAGLQAIGVFIGLFLASWIFALILGVGTTQLMNWLHVGPNIRTFIGDTIARGGNLVGQLILITLATRMVLKRSLLKSAFRKSDGWWKDILFGSLIATGIMGMIFLIEITFGWLVINGWTWQSFNIDQWLRGFWLSILTSTLAAVSEEALLRGFLLTALEEAWGKWIALGVMSILFALPHLLVNGADQTNWLLFTVLLALPGIMLGYIYLKSGTLWLPIGIHFAWNMMQGDFFNLSGDQGPALFGAITHLQGPAWIVGTSYGIEVGLLGIIALLIVLASTIGWLTWRTKQA